MLVESTPRFEVPTDLVEVPLMIDGATVFKTLGSVQS